MIKCEFENGNIADPGLRHVCADVLVIKDNKILLARRSAGLLEAGKWAVIGGFVDRDETVIGAVKREVMEETGWEVKDIELVKIIDTPDRPNDDRQNISFLYVCSATEKTGEADWESVAREWFDWDELPSADKMAFDHLESIKYYRSWVARRPATNVE